MTGQAALADARRLCERREGQLAALRSQVEQQAGEDEAVAAEMRLLRMQVSGHLN